MAVLGGVFSVLPTPFAPSGDIDPESLERVVDLFIADGVNGFTALGVTSEVARLTDSERDHVLDTVMARVNGRVPVVAGTTAEGLRTCIDYTRRAKAAGASAVMISPPRMPKINSDAVARHFAEVASAVDTPIIVQDYPANLRLRDGAGVAGAHRARRAGRADHQAGGSADTVSRRRASSIRHPGWTSASSGGWAACSCSKN